eukprot:4502078-Pleurochrysis_carterae.AAC.2
METILSTLASPATRPAYRIQCQNSGRELIRLLVTEAKASSPSAGLAIESMMDSLLLKGLSEASLTEFNALHHAFTRLNRSLPAHSQLGDALIAEKLGAVVRRLSESINTILDVKLVMKGATGNLPLMLVTTREVLSAFEAREIRRNIELDRPQDRGFVAKQTGKDDRPKSPPPRDRNERGDPSRRTPNKRARFLPARGPIAMSNVVTVEPLTGTAIAPSGRAALAAADATADENLDAAIGNVLLAADAQSRSVEVGAALCVRSLEDTCSLPLTPAELVAQDERELAIAECKAELAGHPLHSEDE